MQPSTPVSQSMSVLHPYELPELIAVEAAGGLAPYLAWVAEQTREND